MRSISVISLYALTPEALVTHTVQAVRHICALSIPITVIKLSALIHSVTTVHYHLIGCGIVVFIHFVYVVLVIYLSKHENSLPTVWVEVSIKGELQTVTIQGHEVQTFFCSLEDKHLILIIRYHFRHLISCLSEKLCKYKCNSTLCAIFQMVLN